MRTTAATTQRPDRLPSDERRTTLLDLVVDLRADCDGSEQALVKLTLDRITTGKAILCGSYRGVDPVLFH